METHELRRDLQEASRVGCLLHKLHICLYLVSVKYYILNIPTEMITCKFNFCQKLLVTTDRNSRNRLDCLAPNMLSPVNRVMALGSYEVSCASVFTSVNGNSEV